MIEATFIEDGSVMVRLERDDIKGMSITNERYLITLTPEKAGELEAILEQALWNKDMMEDDAKQKII